MLAPLMMYACESLTTEAIASDKTSAVNPLTYVQSVT